MVTITLCMMVRNEAATIVETLKSVLPLVDNVCIIDTGSTDETFGLVAKELALAAGEKECVLESHPWVDYATNRNQVLDRARVHFGSAADHWLWMLDGHYLVEWKGSAEGLRGQLVLESALNRNGVMVNYKIGNLWAPIVRFFRADAPWEYKFPTHELPGGGRWVAEPMKDLTVVAMGKTWENARARMAADEVLIRKYLMDQPEGYEPRMMFYLGQTLDLQGKLRDARDCYLTRWLTGDGNQDEVWEAGLRYAIIQTVGPDGKADGYDHDLLEALTHMKPWRAEGWYHLASAAIEAENWESAKCYARIAASTKKPEHDWFMVREDIYVYKAAYQHAMLLIHVGTPEAFDEACSIIVDIKAHLSEAEGLAWRQRSQIAMQKAGV